MKQFYKRHFHVTNSSVTLIVTLLMNVLIIQPVFADAPPMELSLQSAVLFALQENPKINIVKEQETQASEAINEAKSVYYPQVQMSTELGREYNAPGVYPKSSSASDPNSTNAGSVRLSLKQIIYDSPAFTEIDRRKQSAQSVGFYSEATRQKLVNDTIKSYLSVYKFQNDVLNTRELTDALVKHVARLKQAVDAGAESESKLKYAQARLDLAKNKIATASASLNESAHKLQTYTGILPEFVTVKPSELDLTGYDLDFYYALAMSQNPEIVMAESDIKAGKLDLERQNDEFLPKVNFVVEGYQDHNFGETKERQGRAMVQMKYDLFDGFAKKASSSRLKSKVRELEYQKDDVTQELKSKISAIYSEIAADHEKAALKQNETLSYLSLQKINIQALDQGDLDIFEVIENEERLSNARSELNDLDMSVHSKSYEMLRAVGALKKQKFCESC